MTFEYDFEFDGFTLERDRELEDDGLLTVVDLLERLLAPRLNFED